jgi:hypothetical protein
MQRQRSSMSTQRFTRGCWRMVCPDDPTNDDPTNDDQPTMSPANVRAAQGMGANGADMEPNEMLLVRPGWATRVRMRR